jgi:tripartite-type tricarboxylate transporter receptor subunit TctC
VTLIADTPSVIIVNPALGVQNLKEFVALAKAKPGSINYASAGIGTPTHVAGAYFALQAGINWVHVPYKLSADIVSDLLASRVQLVFAPPAYLPR